MTGVELKQVLNNTSYFLTVVRGLLDELMKKSQSLNGLLYSFTQEPSSLGCQLLRSYYSTISLELETVKQALIPLYQRNLIQTLPKLEFTELLLFQCKELLVCHELTTFSAQ